LIIENVTRRTEASGSPALLAQHHRELTRQNKQQVVLATTKSSIAWSAGSIGTKAKCVAVFRRLTDF
jgi:hypothetical protein